MWRLSHFNGHRGEVEDVEVGLQPRLQRARRGGENWW
jgi:hypothetical protein